MKSIVFYFATRGVHIHGPEFTFVQPTPGGAARGAKASTRPTVTEAPRIILEPSDTKSFRVTLGPSVEFVGGWVVAKRVARALCLREGLRSWWNRKSSGKLVEVNL